MKYYCLFCRAGSEASFAAKLRFLLCRDYPTCDEWSVMFPVREIREKKQGSWVRKKQPLLPGYVFLYLDEAEPFPSMEARMCDGFYRVVKYPDGSTELHGSDRKYAQWIRDNQGILKSSLVTLDEGNRIVVISGPLKGMEGNITKLDKHKKRVIVSFDFDGAVREVNLSVDFVSKEPTEN